LTSIADRVIAAVEARRIVASGAGRMIRIAAGVSLAEVGEVCGVDRSAVCRWESGYRRPTGEHAVAYAAFLKRLQETYQPARRRGHRMSEPPLVPPNANEPAANRLDGKTPEDARHAPS
jgi:transcriptional regulator with XRE-family HTH domain